MKFSQVPALGVRACMSSSTPWSLSVLTLSVRSVLPSISVKISALQISDFSILNSSAHTPRYRRFACILTNADARLAVEVVVSLLPPVGLSPTTLHQLAWRTTQKRIDNIWQRIGRLKEKSRGVAQHYDIDVTSSEDGTQALAINWRRQPVNGSMLTHPGVYCLRSNQTDWDEETLWRTYITLTDLEAVFRSLKSELGLRPDLSPQSPAHRRAFVYHRDCLPTGAGHST